VFANSGIPYRTMVATSLVGHITALRGACCSDANHYDLFWSQLTDAQIEEWL
jgi:hypothetical protein